MPVYIRSYPDFSFEIIFTEGRFKKKRLHILINPSEFLRLPTTAKDDEAELNPSSITHLLSMQTSVINSDMIKRTSILAEQTNIPIISNKKTSLEFRELGISVKQLRLLGFDEEVIDGLIIDPVYKEEISNMISPVENKNDIKFSIKSLGIIGKKLSKSLNPLKLSKTLVKSSETSKEMKIDVSNPLAITLSINKNNNILIPLDSRGVDYISKMIDVIKPWMIIIPKKHYSFTYKIKYTKKVLFIDEKFDNEDLMIVPRSHNPTLEHQTLLGGIYKWYEIPS